MAIHQKVYEITKLEYFVGTNEIASLAFKDATVCANLIKRLIAENIEEDSIGTVLHSLLEIIEQASINCVILIFTQQLNVLSINPFSSNEDELYIEADLSSYFIETYFSGSYH